MLINKGIIERSPFHASTHIGGGVDEIDGDQLDIDWNPSNYTPSAPTEADSVDDLSSHLNGIDSALSPSSIGWDVVADNDGATLTTSNSGNLYTCNSGSDQVFTLPSVAAGDIGTRYGFAKLGAGKLTISTADSDTILNSSAGGTIYDSQSGETYAIIFIHLVTATHWAVTSVIGTWTTT